MSRSRKYTVANCASSGRTSSKVFHSNPKLSKVRAVVASAGRRREKSKIAPVGPVGKRCLSLRPRAPRSGSAGPRHQGEPPRRKRGQAKRPSESTMNHRRSLRHAEIPRRRRVYVRIVGHWAGARGCAARRYGSPGRGTRRRLYCHLRACASRPLLANHLGARMGPGADWQLTNCRVLAARGHRVDLVYVSAGDFTEEWEALRSGPWSAAPGHPPPAPSPARLGGGRAADPAGGAPGLRPDVRVRLPLLGHPVRRDGGRPGRGAGRVPPVPSSARHGAALAPSAVL